MKYIISLASILFCYLTLLFSGIFLPNLYKTVLADPINTIKEAGALLKNMNTPYSKHFWQPEKSAETGVTINKEDKSYSGYTFLTGTDELTARLIDQNGTVVHEWGKHPKDVWTDRKHYARFPYKDTFTTSRATLDPETGDAYIIYASRSDIGQGVGIAKYNKDNEVEWTFDDKLHHDVSVSEDRTKVYTLTTKFVTEKLKGIRSIEPPFMDEEILIIDNANGKEIKRISMLDLFAQSHLNIILKKVTAMPLDSTFPYGDILHSNTVEVIPEAAVGKAPMLKKDHLMVSFRNLDLLVIVDPEKEEITWASYGPWKGQHDPEIQDDGSFFLFDNMGSLKSEGKTSRILHIDINDMAIKWEYSGTEEEPFFSAYNSMVDPLPNGNLLVTSSHPGRIFEVTPYKEVVWEYMNPQRKNVKKSYFGPKYHNTPHIGSIFSGKRFKKHELDWLK